MNYVAELLKKREAAGTPINAAVMGAGWFGSGLILEMMRWPGLVPKILFEKRVERGINGLAAAGITKDKVDVVSGIKDFREGLKTEKFLVTDNMELIHDLKNIDVVFDTTGNILAGAEAAVAAINQGVHFITVSSELDGTIGPVLHKIALEKGVIYSNSDGDQPGVLARLISEVESFGFTAEIAGNCKGFLDSHKTPDDIRPWVGPGQNPKMITAFTDGSKQGMELAVVANAFGLTPDVRGMHGPKTTKATLVRDFLGLKPKAGVVDYCLGIDGVDQGGGVFVIGKKEGARVQADMNYLKKGNGPYYLFFRDHHLCYIEAPRSIVDVVLYNQPTIAPAGHYADVLTVAKRDLKAGEKLDGIGGYTVYGLIDRYEAVQKENLLPLGLAEYAVMKRDAERDTPITYGMVEIPDDNLILRLRDLQDRPAESRKDISALIVKVTGGPVA